MNPFIFIIILEKGSFFLEENQEREGAYIGDLDRRLKEAIKIKMEYKIKKKIINRFEEKLNCKFIDYIKEQLLRIGNFMLLSFQLDVHESDKGKTIKCLNPINERVKDYIIELKTKIPSADDIILPVVVTYQFEVPMRRTFLIAELGLDDERIIKIAEEEREILPYEKKGRQYLTFHHSEVSRVFVECYKKFDDLGCLTKKD